MVDIRIDCIGGFVEPGNVNTPSRQGFEELIEKLTKALDEVNNDSQVIVVSQEYQKIASEAVKIYNHGKK